MSKAKRSIPVFNQPIIETHFHLDYLKEQSAEETLAAAKAVGVERFISISVEPNNMPNVLALANQYAEVYATLGVHPHEAAKYNADTTEFIRAHAGQAKVVAIGEIGLDYYYDHCDRAVQRQVFCQQLELAIEHQLPVVIHTREADQDCAAILNEYAPQMTKKGVLHSFTSGLELAELANNLGFCLGINGIVTFNKADNVRAVVAATPIDQLLLETDAPFLAPLPYRGVENSPKYLPFVAEKIAEVKNMDIEEVLKRTYQNSLDLFFSWNTMQKRPTKAELRKQLADEMQNFLTQGGHVQELPRGATGLIDGRYSSLAFDRPKESRTDLTSLLHTIDQRKEQKRKPAASASKAKPKKKVIYDDFGDPIRVVWE